jgi:hypothetical protein
LFVIPIGLGWNIREIEIFLNFGIVTSILFNFLKNTFSQYIFYLNISTIKNSHRRIKKIFTINVLQFNKYFFFEKNRISTGSFWAYFIRYSYYTPINCKLWTVIPLICKRNTFFMISGKMTKNSYMYKIIMSFYHSFEDITSYFISCVLTNRWIKFWCVIPH